MLAGGGMGWGDAGGHEDPCPGGKRAGNSGKDQWGSAGGRNAGGGMAGFSSRCRHWSLADGAQENKFLGYDQNVRVINKKINIPELMFYMVF
jgi:hypothetical protein